MLAQLDDISAFIGGSRGEGSPGVSPYSLSDLSWIAAFSTFFPQKVRFLPSKLGKPLCGTTACINILFVSNPQNVDFAH